MEDYMRERKTPGGALAVVKNGRLVYERGYGWANLEAGEVAAPGTLFRLASLSKPITALGVFKLVEEGRLNLDDRVVDRLSLNQRPLKHGTMDPRWKSITLRHLLQHSGGWNRDRSFDPMFRSRIIAETQGAPPPAQPWAIIDYMLGQPLDFDPGREYGYSNFGYCLLGRVIERVSGMDYGEFMQRQILEPCGVKDMRLGRTLYALRAVGEARYYTEPSRLAASVFDGVEKKTTERVPEPYGGFYLEAMDAHGGWVASAVDLARLSAKIGDVSHCPILRADTLAKIYERPAAPLGRDTNGQPTDTFYSGGWLVRPKGAAGKPNYWHAGSLPGTFTQWVRRGDGVSWVALFNQRSEDKHFPDATIDGAINQAVDSVREWPDVDLFESHN
jgi:N-acyl-D-amino-acid deacylase